MPFFEYGRKEMDHLRRKDKRLGRVIDRMGKLEAELSPDLFSALVNSVVSQQISGKAALTVWTRVRERFGEITPQRLASASLEEVQSCGMSFRKAEYVKGIADACMDGEIDLEGLKDLGDDEVIEHLTSLRGIGTWTAEMMLIFSLQRPNVVSWNDLAIRRGMSVLYGYDPLTKEQFEACRKRYSPYGTVASLYIWEVAHEPIPLSERSP